MMQENNSSNKAIIILRWFSFLPLAFLGSWLAWFLVNILGRISLGYTGFDPESFVGQLYFNTAGHLAMGAAFVYTGARIAPYHKKTIAMLLGFLGLVIGGILLFPLLMSKSGWGIWGAICIIIGISILVLYVYKGEIELN